jgi:hypothetical protein
MANANELRQAIERSALDARATHPQDAEARLAAFVCKLYGAMFALGEMRLEDVLWQDVLMSGGTTRAAAPATSALG